MTMLLLLIMTLCVGILAYHVVFGNKEKPCYPLDDKQMLIIFNSQLKIENVLNPNKYLLFGCTRKQLLNVHIDDVSKMLKEQNRDSMLKITEMLHSVYRTDRNRYFEYSLYDDDGYKYYGMCNVYRSGERIYISVWKVSEQNAIESRHDFIDQQINGLNMALNSANQSIWQYNIREDRFMSLYGELQLPTDFSLLQLMDCVCPESKEELRDIYAKMKSGVLDESSYVVHTWDIFHSDYRFVKVISTLIRNKEGEPEVILGSYFDITEQVMAENRQNAATKTILMVTKMKMGYMDVKTRHIFAIMGKDGMVDTEYTIDDLYLRMEESSRSVFEEGINKLISGEEEEMTTIVKIWSSKVNRYRYYKYMVRAERNENGYVYRLSGSQMDIDDEKQLESEVNRTTELNRLIVENMPIGICHYDASGRLLDVNNAMLNMFGMSSSKDRNLNFYDGLQAPEDIKARIRAGEDVSYDMVYDLGSLKVYNNVIAVHIKQDNGQNGFILFSVNVTKEVEQEVKVQDLSRDLSLALDAGNLYVWRYDIESQTFHTLQGDDRSKLPVTLEENWRYIHPEDKIKLISIARALQEGRIEKASENFRYNFGNGYHTFESKLILKKDGDKIEGIVASFKDISEEIKRKEIIQDLLQQNKTILENVNCGLLFLNADKQLVWENSVFRENRERENSIADICDICNNKAVKTCKRCVMSRCFEKKQIEQSKFKTSDGKIYEVFAIPIWNDSTFSGTVIRMDDITEKEKVLADLKVAKLEAEKADKLKSAFLANMSHEIRTPLNAILGFSELLLNEGEAAERKSYVDVIHKNTDLLLRLISDILDLSKIESGIIKLEPKEFDVRGLLENRILMTQRFIAEEGTDVIVKLESSLESLTVYQDSDRIDQVVGNLLNNACKYTKQGSITLMLEEKDSGFQISVKDTGIGISKENQTILFRRFSKLDYLSQGAGLGLAICKAIIDRSNGRIGCESEGEGKGSTFWVWFPLHYKKENEG